MAEMNRLGRWMVNAFGPRRNRRIVRWIRQGVSLPSGAACLEIGCGGGDLAGRLAADLRPGRYVATDLDPRQLDAARRHLAELYPDGLPPALELREADMLRLPFPDGSFDLAVAVVSLHHASPNHHDASNVPRALAEVDRVLRPGGALAYEEFIHKDVVRSWLAQHGYAISLIDRGLRRESVVARKPGEPPGPRLPQGPSS